MSGPKGNNVTRKEVIERERRQQINKLNRIKSESVSKISEIINKIYEVRKLAKNYGFNNSSIIDVVEQELIETRNKIGAQCNSKISLDEARNQINNLKEYEPIIQSSLLRVNEEQSRITQLHEQKLLNIKNLKNSIDKCSRQIKTDLDAHNGMIDEIKKLMCEYNIETDALFDKVQNIYQQNINESKKIENSLNSNDNEEENLSISLKRHLDLKNQLLCFPKICNELREKLKQRRKDTLAEEITQLMKKIQEQEQQEVLKQHEEDERQFQEKKKALSELHKKVNSKFSELENSGSMDQKTKEKISELRNNWQQTLENNIDNLQYMNQFFAISVNPKIGQFKTEIANYQKLVAKYNSMLDGYIVLCDELNEEKCNFSMTEEGILHMQAAIDRLEKITKQRDNQYISNTIDDVMRDMGYDVIGYAGTRRTGSRHEALYSFNDNTAIRVLVEDNYLTMEIGGLDNCDREPSEKEAAEQVDDMKKFCSDYKLITEKLKDKGLKLDNEHDLPPNQEYSQIHNLKDYDLDEETIENLLNQNRHSTKGTVQNKKQLNTDEP